MEPSVLVVDDEPMTRDLIRLMLQRAGFQVREAEDGEDALRRLEIDGVPDIFILDVMMPNMDGLTLCRKLRENAATAETPVIMLSAKTAQSAVNDGLEAGANKYLTKPIARAELIANLRGLLGIA